MEEKKGVWERILIQILKGKKVKHLTAFAINVLEKIEEELGEVELTEFIGFRRRSDRR